MLYVAIRIMWIDNRVAIYSCDGSEERSDEQKVGNYMDKLYIALAKSLAVASL